MVVPPPRPPLLIQLHTEREARDKQLGKIRHVEHRKSLSMSEFIAKIAIAKKKKWFFFSIVMISSSILTFSGGVLIDDHVDRSRSLALVSEQTVSDLDFVLDNHGYRNFTTYSFNFLSDHDYALEFTIEPQVYISGSISIAADDVTLYNRSFTRYNVSRGFFWQSGVLTDDLVVQVDVIIQKFADDQTIGPVTVSVFEDLDVQEIDSLLNIKAILILVNFFGFPISIVAFSFSLFVLACTLNYHLIRISRDEHY